MSDGSYSYTGEVVHVTVATTGVYDITANGAAGGSAEGVAGGDGAEVSGDVALTAGETLEIVVGGAGASTTKFGGGGGGGSFVLAGAGSGTYTPLVVAGGGGGSGGLNLPGGPGQTSTAGQRGQGGGFYPNRYGPIFSLSGAGGTDGAGGGGGYYFTSDYTTYKGFDGGGGAGLKGDGMAGALGKRAYSGGGGQGPSSFAGGYGFVSPRLPGYKNYAPGYAAGGFGGGGGAGLGNGGFRTPFGGGGGGGGGGGYSGGGGGGGGSPDYGNGYIKPGAANGYAYISAGAGGGGGSFDSGINQVLVAGEHAGNGSVSIVPVIPICYLRGTRILTPSGEQPVEALRIGDRVVTRFGGSRAIAWIGRQSFDPRFLSRPGGTSPVRIRAGALGDALPARDLFVSSGHSMLLDGVLVLARDLVNGVTITRECPADAAVIDYYQLDLDTHDCVLAEGCWSETFADGPGLRDAFHNVAEYRWMFPDRADAATLDLCAPRPEGGPALDAALRPVVARAAAAVTPGRLDGHLEVRTPTRIEGWAYDTAHPALPTLLEVCVGGRAIGSVLACDHRGDLAAAGKGDGRCAFGFSPSAPLDADSLARLRVRRATDGAMLFPRPTPTAAAAWREALWPDDPGHGRGGAVETAWRASPHGRRARHG